MENVWGNTWFVAGAWLSLALLASLISIRIGISVALVETFAGVVGGNFLGMQTTPWIDFLAMFGAGLLAFLAGAEVDPASLRRNLRASLAIGIASYLLPMLGALAFAYYVAGWDLRAAEIAGITLSETSVAVVYAVMMETGLNETPLGKTLLAAVFVTNLGTILTLGVLFANFDQWLILFVVIAVLVLWRLPSAMRWMTTNFGGRISEPEVKLLFVVLCLLGWLSTAAKSEAVLPAYLTGLVIAGVFLRDRVMVNRVRATAFSLLTPFYFMKAGLFVSLPAVLASLGPILALLVVKVGTKSLGVWPVTRLLGMESRQGKFTTMLMSTGLMFGSVAALFGFTNGIIDQRQYTILVSVVIGSAILPTLIAQTFFMPLRSGTLANEAPSATPAVASIVGEGD